MGSGHILGGKKVGHILGRKNREQNIQAAAAAGSEARDKTIL